jgi:HD-like signal output (HDOD) protein
MKTRTLARAGGYLLSLWGLPPEVVEAVACHAEPVDASPGRPPDLVTAVQIAHLVAESEATCDCGRPGHAVVDEALLEATGTLEGVRRWKAEQTMSPA